MSDEQYAFGLGFNLPLNQLHSVVNHLGARNRVTATGRLYPVTVKSSLIDPFPVRNGDQAGGESGDGFLTQDWFLTLAVYGYRFLVDTYFSNETVTQANFTLYTRRHLADTFTRYNAIGILPSAARGDITPLRDASFNGLVRVRWRFNDLLPAS